MEYPEYLAKGWCIGSGAVESACKTVVGQRLKLAGMRWGEDGAARRLPPPRPLPQRERPVGSLLEPRFLPQLIACTTN